MAPRAAAKGKGKAKAKGRGRVHANERAQQSQCGATDGPALEMNAQFNIEIKNAFGRVLSHPKFHAIETSFGVEGATLKGEEYTSDLEQKGFHRFEGNAFMAAIASCDDAPISRAKVTRWINKYYAEARGSLPEAMNYTFKLAVFPRSSPRLTQA